MGASHFAPKRRAGRFVFGITLAALAGSAALGLGVQIREPAVHDEFSYLLAADTFAQGRLSNPPHAMWPHFESFHIIQQPRYASKYPPAQGMVLAVGQRLFGHPIAGVWLSNALMCGAITWMLLAWLPTRWALLGGALAVLQLSIAGYWSQSYWGGAVAGLGGALAFGAARRLFDEPRLADAGWLGLGVLVLANSRPLEGLVALAPLGLLALIHCLREPAPTRRAWRRWVFPVGATIVALLLAWTAYYNAAVTGSAFRMPYEVHRDSYVFVPIFRFGELGEPPAYHHAVLEQLHDRWETAWYEAQQSLADVIRAVPWKLGPVWLFFLGIAGTLPLLALPWIRWDRWSVLALGTCLLLVFVHLFVTTYGSYAHYLAPVSGLVIFLQAICLQRIAASRPPAGRWLAGALVIGVAAGLAERILEHRQPETHWSRNRAQLVTRLEEIPGKDLVIVRYGPRHLFHHEWVYNSARLDEAEVVFARAMEPERDRRLIEAFPTRLAWQLEIHGEHEAPVLEPHPARP